MRAHPAPAARLLALASLALVAVAACGDGTGPKETPGTPGIHLLTTLPQGDSVGAPLPGLEIEVVDARGRPAPGAAVQVEALTAAPAACAAPCAELPTVLFSPDGAAAYAERVSLVADAAGVARTRATLGTVVGDAGFVVVAPAFGYAATLHLGAHAGAVAGIGLAPADTAVQVGNGFALRVKATDRFGNPVADAVSLSTPGPELALNGGGVFGRVFGQALGRGEVVATAGALAAHAFVSVVPDGEVAATEGLAAGSPRVVLMTLAGGRRRTFPVPAHTTAEGWNPFGTQLLLLYNEIGQPQRILTLDAATGATRLVVQAGGPAGVAALHGPRFSRDGQWIFFAGHSTPLSFSTLWKVRVDGTGLQQLVADGAEVSADAPDPSPDGTRLAYSGRRSSADSGWNDLYLLDLATGVHTAVLHELAASPRWSTGGAQIAFVGGDGRAYAVRPDGTGRRALLDAQVRSLGGWSPDDRWLLIDGESQWLLLEAATGRVIPLPQPLTGGLVLPQWNPFVGLEGIR